MRAKYENIFNIQVRLWKLCHPDVDIVVIYNLSETKVYLNYKKLAICNTISNSKWNNNDPNDNYFSLQQILDESYEKILEINLKSKLKQTNDMRIIYKDKI